MNRLRVAFIGWGAIGSRIGQLLRARQSRVSIIGIATIDSIEARALIPTGVPFIADPGELGKLAPDLVVEAAGRNAVEMWGPASLATTRAFAIASTSALVDGALLSKLADVAEQYGSRIFIPSGAIGALDALASAAVLGLDSVLHQIAKPPIAWNGTPATQLFDCRTLSESRTFFQGTARAAARDYPQNANATVVTSLAGIGLDRTQVELIADPSISFNEHRISAIGAFGEFSITLRNRPLATNPKSSELTALSLVRLIDQQYETIVI